MNTTLRQTRPVHNAQKTRIVNIFKEILHTIKLYNWKTESYPSHKAIYELHEKLAEQTDNFIEVSLGKPSSKIDMLEHTLTLYDFDSTVDFKHKLFEFRQFLIDLHHVFPSKTDADLLTICDDMLESINQFLFILTISL